MVDNCSNLEGLREVPAGEILAKIEKGEPVEYDHVRVTGDLDASELDLPIKHVDRTEVQKDIWWISEECKVVSVSIRIANSVFIGKVKFWNIYFEDEIKFENTTFRSDVHFDGTTFVDVSFERAIFKLDATWGYAAFNGKVDFREAKFEGDFVSFGKADFVLSKSEEDACRRAKVVLARAGNRYWEEDHFYREMVAKRKQNSFLGGQNNNLHGKHKNLNIVKRLFFYDFVEYVFVEKIFGYGVHPLRVICSWFSIVILFAITYWITEGMRGGPFGIINYIEGSFATAIAPGYIAVVINSKIDMPVYHAVAILETIIGTFLWAGFIATFAKRYMR